ncbi:hypothetical protein PSPO01_16177 [Paraphaeosphaeria sporulosa]
MASHEWSGGEASGASAIPHVSYDHQNLFTGGLDQQKTELEQKYVLSNIDTVLYALAVGNHYVGGRSQDPCNKSARCLLAADHNMVLHEC